MGRVGMPDLLGVVLSVVLIQGPLAISPTASSSSSQRRLLVEVSETGEGQMALSRASRQPTLLEISGARRGSAVQPRILFLMRTGAPNSRERLAAVRETWAAGLGPESLQIMSPRADKGLGALRAKGNFQCADNHWYGLCCIEATGEAEVLDHRSELDWLFVLDDDVYVNRKNLAAALAKVDANDAAVWGIPGCGSCPHGSHGLCGGGGYAVSRANLDRLADQGKEAFRAKFLEFAKGVAANWSDVSFGCVSQYHSLALKQLDGLYGWSLEPAEMAKAVESKSPLPLTFHYMKPEQMRAVHGMFEAAGAGGGSSQASSELQVAETDGAAADAYASQRAEYVRWQNSIRSTDRV